MYEGDEAPIEQRNALFSYSIRFGEKHTPGKVNNNPYYKIVYLIIRWSREYRFYLLCQKLSGGLSSYLTETRKQEIAFENWKQFGKYKTTSLLI